MLGLKFKVFGSTGSIHSVNFNIQPAVLVYVGGPVPIGVEGLWDLVPKVEKLLNFIQYIGVC